MAEWRLKPICVKTEALSFPKQPTFVSCLNLQSKPMLIIFFYLYHPVHSPDFINEEMGDWRGLMAGPRDLTFNRDF